MQLSTVESRSIVEFLSTNAAYGDANSPIDVVETPTSWVFLCNRFAYKLMKPIKTGFRDCTMVADRMEACRDELDANRRYSPDVYVAVNPVYLTSSGALSLTTEGTIVDWLLTMKRLGTKSSLQTLAAEMNEFSIRRFEMWLVGTLADQPPALLSADNFIDRLTLWSSEHRSQMRELGIPNSSAEQIYNSQREFVESNSELLRQRVCDGRIIDGHGDLRSSHVFIDGLPSIIGCLDDRDPRRINDVVRDFAGLAVECDMLGRSDIGKSLIEHYSLHRSDPVSESLVNFYKSFHAVSRALLGCEQRSLLESSPTERALESRAPNEKRVQKAIDRAVSYARDTGNGTVS